MFRHRPAAASTISPTVWSLYSGFPRPISPRLGPAQARNKWIGAACPAGRSPLVKGKYDADLRRIGHESYFHNVRESTRESYETPQGDRMPAHSRCRRQESASAAGYNGRDASVVSEAGLIALSGISCLTIDDIWTGDSSMQ